MPGEVCRPGLDVDVEGMMERLYHLAIFKFGSVENAIVVGGLLCAAALCGLFVLLCYWHLLMIDRRKKRALVHHAATDRINGLVYMPRTHDTYIKASKTPSHTKKERITRDDYNAFYKPATVDSLMKSEKSQHLTLAVSNEPVEPGLLRRVLARKEQPEPRTPAEQLEYSRGQAASAEQLVKEMASRINSLELIMGDRLYLANQTVNCNLILARRVIRAIQSRMNELEALTTLPSPENIASAYALACSSLEVPKDVINDLFDSKDLKPIPAADWARMLDSLLSEAECCIQEAINQ